MPKIIRSSGVNIEEARPVVVPVRSRSSAHVPEPEPPEPPKPQMDQLYASAEQFVEEIIAKARNDADNMLVDARRETIKVLQDAVQDGWEQGMNQAVQEMQSMQAAAVQEVDGAIESLMDERLRMIRELEANVLELVFDMVDKILAVEMDRGDQWIESMVRTAMQQIENEDSAVMKVAAAARQRVADVAANMLSAAGQPGRISIVADGAMKPGGCAIETAHGSVDCSVERKAEQLKTLLRENA